MKTAESSIEQPGRTLLKSTSHVRVLDSRGNYLRSLLVGLRGYKKFCVNRHFAGNCNFQKWNKNDYTIIIT